MSTSANQHVNILGTGIGAVNYARVLDQVAQWITEGSRGRYVCVTGVHGVMEGFRNEPIRAVHNQADLCVPDGMPLVWVGRRRGHTDMSRVYGPELMLRILSLARQHGWSSFYYGGAPGVAADLAARMEQRFPGLKTAGTYTPPYRPLADTEMQDVIRMLNDAQPDILWIGLSTPKQELLMAALQQQVRAKVMFGVGAAFDFHTGRLKQAPAWMQAHGLEWLFRLGVEPRRLWRRYFRNNPSFLFHIMLQSLGVRRYPLETRAST